MQGNDGVSRRGFIKGTGAATLAKLSWPAAFAAAQVACTAREEAAPFTTLTPAEGREIEAFSARILPTTATPGAREAGVVYFFDTVLGGPMASMLGGIRGTLQMFQAGIGERFPGAEAFSDLSEEDQDTWISENQDAPFFNLGRMLTIMGFFAMSKYGGNKDNVGWDLIGYDPHASGPPPYGFYDAQYAEEKRNGD